MRELSLVEAVLRRALIALVGVLIIGCGKIRHTGKWPAAVVAVDGFNAEQQERLTTALGEMNVRVRRTLWAPKAVGDAFPITIRLVSPWSEAPSRAGYATVDDDGCLIELSSAVFEPDRSDFLKPVVWHEMGHCAGLNHASGEGELMSASSSPLTDYSPDALDRFFRAFLSSAGLDKTVTKP